MIMRGDVAERSSGRAAHDSPLVCPLATLDASPVDCQECTWMGRGQGLHVGRARVLGFVRIRFQFAHVVVVIAVWARGRARGG